MLHRAGQPQVTGERGGRDAGRRLLGADEVYYTGNRFELARRFATDTKQMVEDPLLGVDDLMEMVP